MAAKATKVLQSMEKTMKEEVEKFKAVQKGCDLTIPINLMVCSILDTDALQICRNVSPASRSWTDKS